MPASHRSILLVMIAAFSLGLAWAQYRPDGGGRRFRGEDKGPIIRTEGGEWINEETVRTARETTSHSTGTPNWTNAPGFDQDVFTFTRIIF
jgi:hypothetical protein